MTSLVLARKSDKLGKYPIDVLSKPKDQLVTYLAAAEALCDQYNIEKKHNYIDDHLYPLFYEHNYRENILNLKMTCPCDDNFSDDEQAFLTYYLFSFTTKNFPNLVKSDVTKAIQGRLRNNSSQNWFRLLVPPLEVYCSFEIICFWCYLCCFCTTIGGKPEVYYGNNSTRFR